MLHPQSSSNWWRHKEPTEADQKRRTRKPKMVWRPNELQAANGASVQRATCRIRNQNAPSCTRAQLSSTHLISCLVVAMWQWQLLFVMFGACCMFRAALCCTVQSPLCGTHSSLCCNCRRHTSLVPLFDLANATVRHGYPLQPLGQAARTSPTSLPALPSLPLSPSLPLFLTPSLSLSLVCHNHLSCDSRASAGMTKLSALRWTLPPCHLFPTLSLSRSLCPPPAGPKGRNIFDTLAPELELELKL